MAAVTTPTLRGRRLALELRRLRERTHISQAEAARRLGWSRSKLGRIEAPTVRPTPDDVRQLLQLYGLDADRHDAILHLLEDSWQRGWWTAYGDAFVGNYVMLEDQAEQICTFESAVVPGLLQIPDYARVLISGARPLDDDEIDRRVTSRMARRAAVLDRVAPPTLHAVIAEAALRSVVGDEDVMRAQASALWSAAVERPNVTLQVLPFTSPPPIALEGAFTLFAHADSGLDVGHSEGVLGEWYAESEDHLTRLRVAFAGVCKGALSPEESADWLAARTRE